MNTNDDIRRELAAVAELIASARAALTRNELIDISGIPERVQRLSGAITELAPEEAIELRSLLIELLQDFKAFADDVKNKISEIQADTGSESMMAATGRSGR